MTVELQRTSALSSKTPSVQELLKTLVGFDTTSAKSNLALIAFVEDYLKGHGIASTRVPSPDGTKADLFATIGETRRQAASGSRATAIACRWKASAGPPTRSR